MTLIKKRYDTEAPIVGIDSETELFWYGNMAPRSVCWSFAWRAGVEDRTELLNANDGANEVKELLVGALAGKYVLAFQNGAYDFGVLLRQRPDLWPLVIDVFEAGQIHDTQIAEWLLDTAKGLLRMREDEETGEWKANKSYSLESMAFDRLRWPRYKEDSWRMRYAELRDVPLDQWPEAAVIYPKRDALATMLIAEQQREDARRVQPHDPLLADLAAKCRTYFALHLASAWGMEIDPIAARDFKHRLSVACEKLATAKDDPDDSLSLIKAGLLLRHTRGKKIGQLSRKDEPLRERVLADLVARGLDTADPEMMAARLTDGGKIKANAEALSDCKDPVLVRMADYLECSKQLTSFANKAVELGRGPVHPRYAYADTGRTTCSGGKKRKGSMLAFNVQQMPREVPEAIKGGWGMRENFVPRAGFVYSSTDYAILEMKTWAQCRRWLFPDSENPLLTALNNGKDPHAMVAGQIMRISYEEVVRRLGEKDKEVKAWRQNSKPANYGFPGGMGHKKFVSYAKGQGVVVDLDTAQMLRDVFSSTWQPKEYFDYVGALTKYGSATIVQMGHSQRIRGDVGYTDCANGFFQGLASDLATDSAWRIVIECYDECRRSPLLGSRLVGFFHDENFCEHPEEAAHEAATRVGEIMEEAQVDWCPDLRPEAKPALMRRWSKAAGDAVHDEHGRLVPWEDRH